MKKDYSVSTLKFKNWNIKKIINKIIIFQIIINFCILLLLMIDKSNNPILFKLSIASNLTLGVSGLIYNFFDKRERKK